MTHRVKVLFSLCAALLGACGGAVIQGDVVVGPGHPGQAVVAVIWSLESEPGSTRPRLVALGQNAIGTAPERGGRFAYTFHALDKGRYVLGAYLDRNDDRQPDCELHAWDLGRPVSVDPGNEEGRRVRKDVYLGATGPDRAGLSGTLHVSTAARPLPLTVYLLDGPPNSADTQALAEVDVCEGGIDVPYSFFDLAPGSYHVMAVADVNSDDSATDACAEGMDNDRFAFADNPVVVEAGQAKDGVDLWLDVEAPGRGTVAGTLELSGPLPGGRASVHVFGTNPAQPGSRPALIAQTSVVAGAGTSLPFALYGLPLRPVYVMAYAQARVDGCPGPETPYAYQPDAVGGVAPVTLSAETPAVRDYRLRIPVGRIAGRVDLANAPAALRRVLVLASVPTPPSGFEVRASDERSAAVANGVFRADFDVFGLEDGTYQMYVLPDINDDGAYEQEQSAGYYFAGTPATVVVQGGGRAACDFATTLP